MKFTISLPEISVQRLAVKVKPAAERSIRQHHPWIYDQSIEKINKEGSAGDLAIIFDQSKNKFLALGLYDPYSPIRIKLLQFRKPATIDESWFEAQIKRAYEKRIPLFETDTDSYRLIFGENDGFPGLIADVYADVLVVKLYSLAWLPYLHQIFPSLVNISKAKALVVRLSRNLQQQQDRLHGLRDGLLVYGHLADEEVIFKEHGLRFAAHVIKGHKTGYFLDHRHNRRQIGTLANGRRVLDVFSYAGGFSVHALAGGAREVVSLDISKQALAIAQKNVALNFAHANHQVIAGDAFTEMAKLADDGEQFSLIVVDPPSFAKQEREKARALESYARLTKLAASLIDQNGLLVLASCSSRVSAEEFFLAVTSTLSNDQVTFEELARTEHDIDHPVGFPEGSYLKTIYLRVL